jgi:TetR/AcrR family transcriptional regulator, cholesterol catabolism regulator
MPISKDDILTEAAKLFRERGYPKASMRELAQRVGLEVSSLYSHISSKEQVLQEICFSQARRFLEFMTKIESEDISNKQKLEALIRFHLNSALEDPTTITSFTDEWRHLSEPHRSSFRNDRRDYEARFEAIIRQGILHGELHKVNAHFTMSTILSGMRWIYYRPVEELRERSKAIENDLIRILLNGLTI